MTMTLFGRSVADVARRITCVAAISLFAVSTAHADPPTDEAAWIRANAIVKTSAPAKIKGQAESGTIAVKAESMDTDRKSWLSPPEQLVPNAEDEGSILLATPTGLVTRTAVKASGVIGDGPYGYDGTGSGDFDFYVIPNVRAGQTILVDVETPDPFSDLDSFVALYDSAGNVVAFNDDGGGVGGLDSLLLVTAPADGDYFVSVTGFGTFLLNDPFDSSSGPGAGSEGPYDVLIGLDYQGEFTQTFYSGPDWNAFSKDPGPASFSQGDSYLGSAQRVCLNDDAPWPCPDGALRYGFPGWGWFADLAGIEPAAWIWAPDITGDSAPAELASFYFSKTFVLPGYPVRGILYIAADDFAEVRVNGSVVGSVGSVTDIGLAGEAQSYLHEFDLTSFLKPGRNVITIRGQNGPPDYSGCESPCTYGQNPAGVVFGGSLEYSRTRDPAGNGR